MESIIFDKPLLPWATGYVLFAKKEPGVFHPKATPIPVGTGCPRTLSGSLDACLCQSFAPGGARVFRERAGTSANEWRRIGIPTRWFG